MNTSNTPKKPALTDWHPADIKAALEKAGWTLRKLAEHHGVSPSAIIKTLRIPYPKSEARIAAAIGNGVAPTTIWPSRYNPDGTPKSGRGERGIGRARAQTVAGKAEKLAQEKDTKAPAKRNVSQPEEIEHARA